MYNKNLKNKKWQFLLKNSLPCLQTKQDNQINQYQPSCANGLTLRVCGSQSSPERNATSQNNTKLAVFEREAKQTIPPLTSKYQFLLLFQFNNVSMPEFHFLFKQFVEVTGIQGRVIKNTVLAKIFPSTFSNYLFQGPTFLIQTNSLENVKKSLKIIKNSKSHSKFVFLGGFILENSTTSNQFCTYLDFEKLNTNTINLCVGNIENTLNSFCSSFQLVQYQLIHCLELVISKKINM